MFKEKEEYYYIEEFEKFGIIAVYTKKDAGNMSDYCQIENQEKGIQKKNREKLLKKLGLCGRDEVMAFQTHSSNIQVIGKDTGKYYYEKEDNIDGFITDRKDVVLFTFYADCLPIFVHDSRKHVIGVWHSGWPGSFKEIMRNGLEIMKKEYGSNTEHIAMALGIGIRQENYEVGMEFYERFAGKFGADDEIIRKSFIFNSSTEKYHFDNVGFNEVMALRLGIRQENLIIANADTWDDKFHSHRREGKMAGRAAALISFK